MTGTRIPLMIACGRKQTRTHLPDLAAYCAAAVRLLPTRRKPVQQRETANFLTERVATRLRRARPQRIVSD